MTIYNRRDIPHPVLKPQASDYRPEILFQADMKTARRNRESGEISIPLQYRLNDQALLDLIENGKAEYLTMTDCTKSHLREAHHSRDILHTATIVESKYAQEMSVLPFITATENIQKFQSENWSDLMKTFLPNGTDIPKGAILAMGNPKTIELGKTTDLGSCVQIVASDNVDREPVRNRPGRRVRRHQGEHERINRRSTG